MIPAIIAGTAIIEDQDEKVVPATPYNPQQPYASAPRQVLMRSNLAYLAAASKSRQLLLSIINYMHICI